MNFTNFDSLELSTQQYFLTGIILLFAFISNSIAGFGSGSLSMGFLVNILKYQRAVFLVNIQEFVSYSVLVYKNRKVIKFSRSLWIILGSMVGIYIGVQIIKIVDIGILKSLLGLVVITGAFRALNLKEKKIALKTSNTSDFLVSLIVGISGSLFNVEGPILASYLRRRIKDPHKLRLELIFLQFAIGGLKLAIFLLSSIISPTLILFSALFIPVTIFGSLLGNYLAKKIPKRVFNYIIFTLLTIAGLSLIFR